MILSRITRIQPLDNKKNPSKCVVSLPGRGLSPSHRRPCIDVVFLSKLFGSHESLMRAGVPTAPSLSSSKGAISSEEEKKNGPIMDNIDSTVRVFFDSDHRYFVEVSQTTGELVNPHQKFDHVARFNARSLGNRPMVTLHEVSYWTVYGEYISPRGG
jgi:hypothetical protein